MHRVVRSVGSRRAVLVTAILATFGAGPLSAHCDTLGGPVIEDARRALESGDVAPALKWIGAGDEPVVRQSFATALRVRKLGDEARELADRSFFETLVRLHRAGEGASYDGLKPAAAVPPLVLAADLALDAGSADELSRKLSGTVAEELGRRYRAAREGRAHAEHSVEAGRAYVAAYVEYVHFVEGISDLVGARGHAHAALDPHAHARP